MKAEELPITRMLVERALAFEHAKLPVEIRELAGQCLLDWLGVTLAGMDEPLSKILLDEALEEGGKAAATLVGRRERVTLKQAALINGAASHALDYDDVNLTFHGHPSVAVLPGLLALAEARGARGADVVTAFVAGYETGCRTGALMGDGHYNHGFHATATVGSVGAAAACARLIGLDAQKTRRALGIAATQAAGLKSMFGTMCKPLHAGKAAQNGLFAALLAERGFTAREDALECEQGFGRTLTPTYLPNAALMDPPGGFHLRNNLFKYHAACYLTHAAIESAKRLRDEHALQPKQVRSVTVLADAALDKVCNIPDPRTGLETKFSLRHTVAQALTGIDTASSATFSDAGANDPALVQLREKVRVEFAARPQRTSIALRIETGDGLVLEAEHDSGVPASDVAHQGRRLEEKFLALAKPVLGEANARRAAQLCLKVDGLPKISNLLKETVP